MNEGLPISGDVITISREALEEIVKQGVQAAVREEFNAVGLWADAPATIEEARKDFQFVRSMRLGVNSAANKIAMTLLVALVLGLIAAAGTGFRLALKG